MPCDANCHHNFCTGVRHPAARPSRRAVVGMLAAAGAGVALGAPRALAQNVGQGAAGSFAPVFEELNRRKVAVFVHPTMSCCGMSIPGIDPPAIDFSTDTTRTLASLAYSGTFARSPDVKFIFSHGGGTMPMIVQRIAGSIRNFTPEQRAKILPNGAEAEFKRHHYDIASVALNPAGMAAVFKLIPLDRLLYGSDAPFGSTTAIAERLAKFELSAADITAIRHDNALRLFPRFAA
jgi:predicted TIM-barrel fold metal-dependent hydrolase